MPASRFDEWLRESSSPSVSAARLLWCVAALARGAATATAAERAALRRRRGLWRSLRPGGAGDERRGPRLLQHALAVRARLVGDGDRWFDEAAVMDSETLCEWAAGLRDRAHPELRIAAAQLARRVSELAHVSVVLVFDEPLFDALLDALESHDAPVVAEHALHSFVNLCGHPKLHFKLARVRRVVDFATHTLFRLLSKKSVRGASRHARRALESAEDNKKQLPPCVSSALKVMAPTVPCAMLLANLLSFPENRLTMLSLYPGLPRALQQCDSQVISLRLREVARRAADFLREDNAPGEMELPSHSECGQSRESHMIPED